MLAALPSLALLGGAAAANTAFGVVLVLAEPLLLALGLYVVGLFAWHSRWAPCLSVAFTIAIGSVALHRAPDERMSLDLGPEWLRPLRSCALLGKPVEGPVRVISWTVDPDVQLDSEVEALLAYRPDIVVLLGTDGPVLGDTISTALGGEAKFFPGSEGPGGLTAVVRGTFQYCGGTEDSWTISLPSAFEDDAQAVVSFPLVEGVGVIPLVVARLDQSHGLSDLGWSKRVVAGAVRLGEIANTLGTRRMVVLGNLQAPSQAVPLARPLRAAGLRPAATPPNWPAVVAGLPFLPQHALDQVWTGRGWHVQSARVLEHGGETRAPILVDLTPSRL
jgi:hypothetical protein